jgi:2-iminobutanoate/2-iminopropanoate deaminase
MGVTQTRHGPSSTANEKEIEMTERPADLVRGLATVDDVPPADGAYSLAVSSANFIFLAGQGPFDALGKRVGDTIEDQVEATLDNLERVTREAGSSLQHAVRFGVYLSAAEHFPALNASFDRLLKRPFPARTTLVVALDGFDVEIDAIVAIPTRS